MHRWLSLCQPPPQTMLTSSSPNFCKAILFLSLKGMHLVLKTLMLSSANNLNAWEMLVAQFKPSFVWGDLCFRNHAICIMYFMFQGGSCSCLDSL